MRIKTDTVFKYQIDDDWHYAIVVGFAKESDARKTVKIPEKIDKYRVHSVGKYAFYKNNNIETVQLPGDLKVIEEGAFGTCKNLTHVYIYPSSLVTHILTIDSSAFSNCCALQSFIGEETMYITASYCAFYGCKSLKKVQGRLCSLDTLAFSQCKQLNDVTFANHAKWSPVSFDGCSELTRVLIIGDPNPNLPDECFDWLKKLQITCQADSKILDWAYNGVNIKVIQEESYDFYKLFCTDSEATL